MTDHEQTTQWEASRISRNPRDHKFFFGSYLNIALHNSYLILQHLVTEHDWLSIVDFPETNLHESRFFNFPTDKKIRPKPQQVHSLMKALVGHFPFLAVLAAKPEASTPNEKKGFTSKQVVGEAVPEEALKHLRAMLKRLDTERNFYSHHVYTRQALAMDERPELQVVFEASAKHIRRRFEKSPWMSEEALAHLSPEHPKFAYRMVADDGLFEDMGLFFFTCLFLEPADANLFLGKLERLKGAHLPFMQATRKCFTNFCCSLPLPRLESSDVKLDMLNELYRCPKELYGVIREEDRKRFWVEEKQEDPEEASRWVEMKRHDDRFPYFAMRYMDDVEKEGKPFFANLRFHLHLARLRTQENPSNRGNRDESREFMKELNTFGRLRDFTLESMPPFEWKQEDGSLFEAIEQFAPRYNEIGNRIAIKFMDEKGKPIWPKAKSVFQAHRTKAKNARVELNTPPDVILSTHELQNLFFYQYLHHKGWIPTDAESHIKAHIAQFHQLCKDAREGKFQPVREATFYKRTNNEDPDDKKQNRETKQWSVRDGYTENSLTWLNERKEILEGRLEGYGLKCSQLPDALREYLLGYASPDYLQQARRKFNDKIDETKLMLKETRLKHEKTKANPELLKKHRPLKAGELSDTLAADINFMKPLDKDKGGRASEDQFRRLQEHLSFFSIRKPELEAIFLELELEGDGTAPYHPFLHKVEWRKCTGVLHFFQDYFNQKILWMMEVRDSIEPKDEKFKKRHIKYITAESMKERYDYFLQIGNKSPKIKDYSGQPMMLPRGLFNASIAKALAANGYEVNLGDSITRLIGAYQKGDSQKMYEELPRLYLRDQESKEWFDDGLSAYDQVGELMKDIGYYRDALDAERAKPRSSNRKCDELLNDLRVAKKQYGNAVDKEERLRQIKSDDQTLMLMIQDLANMEEAEVRKEFEAWKLSGIRYPAEPSSVDGAASEDILDKVIKMRNPLHGRIVVADLKIKHHGKFRRFMKDRRLENLVQYFPKGEIEKEFLEDELDRYDKGREELMETILIFEAEAAKRWLPDLKAAHVNLNSETHKHHYIEHTAFLNVADSVFSLEEFTGLNVKNVKFLRDKFAHNQVPIDSWLRVSIGVILPGESVVQKLVNLSKGFYESLTSKIKTIEYAASTTAGSASLA